MKRTTKATGLLYAAAAFFILIVASCRKEDDLVVPPPAPPSAGPSAPVIGALADNGQDTLTVGDTLVLRPGVSIRTGITYSWTVDGKQYSSDSAWTFIPSMRGDYKVTFTATNAGGPAVVTYNVHVWGKYENGFYIMNEGWYGHGTGSVSFFRYDTQKLEDSVFTKANPGKDLMPATSTVEHGAIYNGKLYILTKVRGPLVVTDAYSLQETGRVPASSTSDWRAFVGIDSNRALVSSQTGVYLLNLSTLAVGTSLSTVTGQVGDMIRAGNYIFVLSATKGVVILNAVDFSVAKTIAGMQVAFTRTPDGAVWVAGGTSLVRINPATLDTTKITVPFTVNGSWAAWHPGTITASTRENAVYLANNGSLSGGTKVYKYVDGNAASLQTPLISIAAGKELYGSGIAYDPIKNLLVVNTVQSGFGTNYSINDLNFYDPTSGALKTDIPFSGYYLPALAVFH